MVKDDIIFLNANGSLIFRLRLVFGLCRLRFMCCMILIRVSHPAQQGVYFLLRPIRLSVSRCLLDRRFRLCILYQCAMVL